jgi:hypothetical protein
MFPSHELAIEGKVGQLNPYYYLNQFFWATIDPKQGDVTALRYYAPNLLNRMAPDEEGFCIFDFIWNELRRAMNDPMKYLPYAPISCTWLRESPISAIQRMLSMSPFVTSVIEPRKLQRLASMLSYLVQLLAIMMCQLHPPHLGLLVDTVAPWSRGF